MVQRNTATTKYVCL